jgi:hypothetical protein
VSAVQLPSGDELIAIAAIWRSQRREIVTSFLGNSMLPTIAPGVEVTIDCAREWNDGDVIAFVGDGHLVVHRIVASSPDRRTLLTLGDYRIVPDAPIEDVNAIIGVITRIRSGNNWIDVPPAPRRSFLRGVILNSALRAVARGADACRQRLRVFHLGGSVVRASTRAFRRVLRFRHR